MAGFGERIKELRKQKGLTQRQMAESFGITERNYQRYEASDSPSNETLIKLADFFEVTTDYLLGRINNANKCSSNENTANETPSNLQSILELDTDELKRKIDNYNNETPRLQILFDEPLQSYAVWLRNVGIPISGGGESGQVVVEIEDDLFFDITDNVDAILQMGKDHFKLLARQFGKSWPLSDENLD